MGKHPILKKTSRERTARTIALVNEGAIHMQQNRLPDAEQCFRSALLLSPQIPEVHNNLGSALREQGRIEEAQHAFISALKLRPRYASAHSNLLFTRHYASGLTLQELRMAHENWATQQLASIAPKASSNRQLNTVAEGRRLVVGLLSSDLRLHPVGIFIAPWILKHDPDLVRIVVFSDGQEDGLTQSLKLRTDAWHDVRNLNDDAVRKLILEEKVDVLIDLAGHTAGNRLLLFGSRAAPIQVSWLGYPSTTGVPAMDAVLTDAYTVPEGNEEAFTEKVVRLPGLRFCYSQPRYAPPVSQAPFDRCGFIMFGSFNNLAKISPEVMRTWAVILKCVPNSRLLLKWKSLANSELQQRLRELISANGIDPNRIELRGWSSHDAMLDQYSDVDIALDPFPFSGGLTSCDSLYMGVPVLTLEGKLPVSRQTASFMRVLGLTEWVAHSVEDYVQRAIDLAAKPEVLGSLRQRLRQVMQNSILCDELAFAISIDQALIRLASMQALGCTRFQRHFV